MVNDTVTPFCVKCYTLLFSSLSCSALSHTRQSHANPYFIGWSDKNGIRVNSIFFSKSVKNEFSWFEIQNRIFLFFFFYTLFKIILNNFPYFYYQVEFLRLNTALLFYFSWRGKILLSDCEMIRGRVTARKNIKFNKGDRNKLCYYDMSRAFVPESRFKKGNGRNRIESTSRRPIHV